MRISTGDMTQGRLHGKIVRFAVPLVATNFLQLFFNMADLAVAGQFAGPLALGAVGSTTISIWLLTGLILGMANGVNVVVARALGAGDHDRVVKSVHTSFLICSCVGLIMCAVGLLCANPLLRLLGTKPELLRDADLYLKICAAGFPALALYNFGNATLSAAGDTKTPLVFLTISGVLNVILNLIFVICFHMGVVGVALATTISQYLSAFLIVRLLVRTPGLLNLHWNEMKPDRVCAKNILGIGVPTALQNSIFNGTSLFLQAGLNTFDAITVAGSTAAGNADNIIYNVMTAFYTACSSFVSQNFGAKKPDRILRSYLICLAYTVGLGFAIGGGFMLFGEYFIAIFNSDPQVLSSGMERLYAMAWSFGIASVMDCTVFAVRGLGKSLIPTIMMILGVGAFRVVWMLFVFPQFGTLTALYTLYPVSWSITAVLQLVYFIVIYRNETKKLKVTL